MKLIHDPKKKHWAIGIRVTCDRCTAVYELETRTDFRAFNTSYVTSTCPNCEHVNTTNRTITVTPKDSKWNSGTCKITVDKTSVDWNAFDKLFKDFDDIFR